MSLRKLIEAGTTFLQKNKIENPRRNAEIILSHLLEKPFYYIYTVDFTPSQKVINLYNKLLLKRVEGIPLQYLIKKVNFYGYDFFIEKGVFIPRPETEILVEKTVEIYRRYFSPARITILDIGTGCGNIGISLAKEIKNCHIVATDISEKAIKTAIYNAETHKVKSRIRFVKTYIYPSSKNRFDIIVTNPPYIPNSEIPLLDREVRKEPIKALSGGSDGLSIIKKIMEGAGAFLHRGGFLLIEIGDKQGKFIKQIKSTLKLITIEKDLAKIERIAIFRKG